MIPAFFRKLFRREPSPDEQRMLADTVIVRCDLTLKDANGHFLHLASAPRGLVEYLSLKGRTLEAYYDYCNKQEFLVRDYD